MDELNQPSGNPYGRIDNEEDDGQPQVARGDAMPRETSSLGAGQRSHVGNKEASDPALFDLDRYAEALRAIPSGNPCARAQGDDEEEASLELADEVRPSDRSSHAWALGFTSQPGPRRWARKRYTDPQIEEIARSVQRELWQRRAELFGDTSDPIRVLNPAKVLELYGYEVRYHDGGLGRVRQDGATFEVAGLIDPASKVVEISTLPLPMERLFTLAHELGHVVLNSVGTGVHRDRPLNGTRTTRDVDERSADKFAAYFLMPGKALCQVFTSCFLTDRFELNDATAFALRASTLDDVQAEFPTLRAMSCYIASAEHYNSRVFRSLASIFNVSPMAMAIRLEELGLVR